MPVTYESWLVLLSIVMAIQGAYVGLSLSSEIAGAAGMRRRMLLAGSAFSLAVAIWTMHFVGMLAVRVPFPVDYLVFPTLLSFLVCVIVVGAAVYAISSGPLTPLRLTLSAGLMGVGIFTMHYLGMSALHASAHMNHAPVFVAASLAVAIAASGLALWLAGGRGGRPPLLLSAVAFGIAVSGMHYTAMEGVTLFAHATATSTAPALSIDLLAIVVAVVGFGLSAIFLLFLVPDHARAEPHPEERGLGRASRRMAPARSAEWTPTPSPSPQGGGEQSARGVSESDHAAGEMIAVAAAADAPVEHPELGRGGYAPLGGAGGPPRRFARHLPIERDGGTQFVPVEDVVAIHANAHYTYIFNGQEKLFCPLAIGDVEQRLDTEHFIRVHRSHIVNIARVIGHRRSGDNELIEMDADHYTVPVSRSRIGSLKSRVAAINGPRRRHHIAAQ